MLQPNMHTTINSLKILEWEVHGIHVATKHAHNNQLTEKYLSGGQSWMSSATSTKDNKVLQVLHLHCN